MRVFVTCPAHLSRGIHRVAAALRTYAPPVVQIVNEPTKADLRVLHVIGTEGLGPWLDMGPYALVQYCLRTSQCPHPHQWAGAWRGAQLVASYYDLAGLWAADPLVVDHARTPHFLRLPLGIGDVFRHQATVVGTAPRDFLAGTSGYVAGTETVDLVAAAADAVGGRLFHLGPDLGLPATPVALTGIDDVTLAGYWSRCQYVSGLRRVEGFELPAYEGLACGARPLMFDREDARYWLGEHADYLDEGADIFRQLVARFRGPYRAVTPTEQRWAATTFSWGRFAESFWKELLTT